MARRLGRMLVALVVTGAVVAGATPVAAAPAGEPPSDEFCGAFSEYYAVRFLVALANAFAESAPDDEGDDAANVTTEIYLVLSPKLQRSAETMLDESPPTVIKQGLQRQLKVWRKGVALLRSDVGLDDEAIEAIADLDISTSSGEAEDVLGEDVSDKDIKAAAKKLTKAVDALEEGATKKEDQAFEQASVDCGVVPDPEVDCAALVTNDEASALLGELSDTTEGEGCSWVGPDVEEGDSTSLAVEVYTSDAAYQRLTEQLAGTGEPVPELGERAAIFDGYSSQTIGSTCGKTVVAVVDGRTLQLALCLGDTPVMTEQVVALAGQVVSRL